jgi:hypothetical protein
LVLFIKSDDVFKISLEFDVALIFLAHLELKILNGLCKFLIVFLEADNTVVLVIDLIRSLNFRKVGFVELVFFLVMLQLFSKSLAFQFIVLTLFLRFLFGCLVCFN